MPKNFLINHISINRSNKPFIIAEMSGNHNQSLDRALEIESPKDWDALKVVSARL